MKLYTSDLSGVAYGNGTFVAVGGTILTSHDGVSWIIRTLGDSRYLNGVAYGNGTFVALGSEGTILTSSDGITWTTRTSGTSSALSGIAYGNDTFVAVGSSSTILQSDPLTGTPKISINPVSLNFGNVNVGSTSNKAVTVKNDGNADLIIGTITSPSVPFNKIGDECAGQTFAPGASCTLTYQFSPTSAGSFSSNSNILLNDPDENPVTISLNGVGVAETITAPNILTGPTSGTTGTSYSYTTGGSISNFGHSVEYQFDWKGDGTDLSPWAASTQSKTWTVPGTNNVRAKARCATHTDVVSSWSGSLSVNISPAPVPSTVATNPSGLQIIVDGSTYTAPRSFDWTPGSSNTLSVSSPQSGTTGTRYIYSSWSDGGAQTHTITSPSSSFTYTASFNTQYSLTTSVNPSGAGTITPSGTNWYDSGQNVSVSATANPGYTFSGWSGDLSGTANPTSITMNGPNNVVANFTQNQYTLTVNIAPSGSGSVTKNPNKATYTYDEQVQLTATANPGYTFNNWSGDATGSTNPVTVTINGNKNMTANFTQNQYTLTVNINPIGAGLVTKSPEKATYVYGDTVQLTARANPGYTFNNWSGDVTGSTNPVTVTIDGNKNVTANFTQDQYTLTVNISPPGAGLVTKVPDKTTYVYGDVVTLTATANAGYTFSNWSGDATGSSNPVTMTISGNKSVTANFIQNQYIVTVNINPIGAGSINKSPDKITYVYGDTVKLTATANPGYTFSNWSNDVTGSTNPVTVTINGNKNVTANFTQNQYTVTVNITPSGSGSVTKNPDKPSFIYGEQVTLTATANSRYTFDRWTGDVNGTSNPITLTINENKKVTAHFAQIPETVSTPTTPSGPSSGTIGAPYPYTTGGSTSSYDHPVEYQFDWKGNGSDLSPWGSATQSKTWTSPGTYSVKARARCVTDNSVTSSWSSALSVTISNPTETISTPNIPTGPTSGTTNNSYSYSTGGSISSLGHPVEYQFDWKGDGTDLSPWGSANQSKIWTAAWTCNVRARARCIVDTSVMSDWSGPIQVIIASSRSTRTLPLYYTPSLPVTVVITINPGAAVQTYSAEDSPPNGWIVSNINENGQWDDVNKKVKWGVFFDNNPRTLTYQVTPPIGETGVKSFSGQASFDGVNESIGGDSTIELGASLHPADTSLNFELSISEVTAYAAAWRSGQAWPVPPNPILIEYPTNAGYLWRSGEVYLYDGTRIPPSCWVPGAATGSLSVMRNLSLKNQTSLGSQVALSTGTTTRDLPDCYTPSTAISISITVTPGQGTQVYAVEDSPPIGWTVSDINKNGGWDNVKKKVKWGPFFDHNNRTLTYKVTPPSDETGTKTFSGTASFDGKNVVIGGELILGRCASSPLPDLTGSWTIPPKQTCKNTSRGQKCTIRGTFTISNIGNYDASSTYVDLYLSDNDNYNEGDILLKSVRTGKVKAGKNKAIKLSYSFSLGVNVTGKYIIAVIEKLAEELDETNNIIVFGPIQ